MTPERLNELRQQRALVQQHLEWLDREISAGDTGASGQSAAPIEPIPTPAPSVTGAVFSEYEPDPEGARQSAKRGCLIYAAIGFALLTGILVALYYWKYSDHPLLFAPSKGAAGSLTPPLGGRG